MLKVGTAPERFGCGVIIRILKCLYKFIDDVGNYHPISIIPIISKVFETSVSGLVDNYLVLHHNQFGFSKNGGSLKADFAFSS